MSLHPTIAAMATLAVLSAGCAHSTPTAPDCASCSAPAPQPANQQLQSMWNLNRAGASVTGPNNCDREKWSQVVALAGAERMVVTQKGSKIDLAFPAGDIDGWDFTGTLSGADFTASGSSMVGPYTIQCPDGSVLSVKSTSGTVTGSFSADGRRLTANEVWADTLDSGTVQATFSWTADIASAPQPMSAP